MTTKLKNADFCLSLSHFFTYNQVKYIYLKTLISGFIFLWYTYEVGAIVDDVMTKRAHEKLVI